MKRVSMLVCLGLILSACSYSATPAPVATAPIAPTLAPSPTATLPESFKTQLTGFLQAGSKLTALSEQGVTYLELRQEVATAKGLYDLLVSTWPEGFASTDLNYFDTAFKGWALAIELWSMKINEQDEPVEPDINFYKTYVAFGGDRLAYDKHPANFIVKDYRNKQYIPFDENIRILLGISSENFANGKTGILSKLR